MRRRILICSAVIVIILIILFLVLRPHGPTNFITLYGNVDVRQVDLGFRVDGKVQTMLVEEGDWVTPGALIGSLDKQPYLDLVDEARATLLATKLNLKNAEKIVNRRKELVAIGGVSDEEYQNAITSRNVYKANLEAAQAQLDIAEKNLSYTDVYAPSTGSILTRIREPGTVVKVADPIYTLSIASPIWVRAFVAEPSLGLVYFGQRAEIYTDTPGGKVYEGHVGFISPVAEFTPKTVETTSLRTDLVYRLRIYADNPDFELKQGMPVTVKLFLKEPILR